ncbi:DUF1684 domain-containing protein [soil metagenome]
MTIAELDLLDWRRRVFALYAEIRATDPRVAHARWRAARDELFGTHPQTPFEERDRAAFAGLAYWDYDVRFRFTAAVQPAAGERVDVGTSDGSVMAMRRFGAVQLPVGRLDVYWIDVYGGGVFVPFRDATSGSATYGGGRYLLDTIKGADLGSTPTGELVLDFNFAYHPSCHYSYRWACPLATREGQLAAAIEAGERIVV